MSISCFGSAGVFNVSDYKDLFPLFVFDVSKQSEKLKNSVTDIQVKAYFNENVPANTEAFALVISDRVVSFASDGNRITVISLKRRFKDFIFSINK